MKLSAYLFLFLLFSCSSETKKSFDYDSVANTTDSETENRLNETNVELNPGILFDNNGNKSNVQREPVFGLYIGPGMFKVFSAIEILRMLEDQSIKVNLIAGMEMGLVLASLYAKYGNSNKVEWVIYNYLKKNENKSPQKINSNKWLKKFDQSVGIEFSEENIEGKNITLMAPRPDSDGKIKLVKRGPLYPIISSSIDINNELFILKNMDSVFLINQMKTGGADIVLALDFLDNADVSSDANDDIEEFYHKAKRLVEIEKKNNLEIITIDTQASYEILSNPQAYSLSEDTKKKILDQLKNAVEKWKSGFNNVETEMID